MKSEAEPKGWHQCPECDRRYSPEEFDQYYDGSPLPMKCGECIEEAVKEFLVKKGE